MGWCEWFAKDEMYEPYHRLEWGIPCHDDRRLFEYLMLECLQCGLSWTTIMRKRRAFDEAFADWDWEAVAGFEAVDVEHAMSVEGMIRSPRKVAAIVNNAGRFAEVVSEFESFDAYIWSFTDGRVVVYDRPEGARLPASNGLSQRVATDLKGRGFKFVGPTSVYAYLQGIGVIHDHDRGCEVGRQVLATHPHVMLPPDGEVPA